MQRRLSTQEEVKFGGAAMSLPTDLSCLQADGGADREAALATLEKQLICPICLELFSKPVVILPCQHNLCRKCANELYQPSLFQARTTMMVNSGRFRCPSCRHEVVLDRHGVYGLQRNLLVENIIDIYKQEVSNNNNASPLPLPPPPAQLTCSDHEGEKVNIYCLTCKVPTCSLCKVFGAHQSCQVAPLTDIYQQKKEELSQEVSSLVALNNKIQSLINELEETIRNIEDNSKAQKQSVCETFNHMMSVLGERHKVMAQQISSEQEEKTSHTQALMRCYGDSVETNAKLMEKAASSLEELDMAAFVQSSGELITKVTAATSSCPTETLKPGYDKLSPYTFNFSREEGALKSIDFIQVVPEEQDVESEPEESSEPSAHDTGPEHHQENVTPDMETDAEPVTETLAAVVPPAEEPPLTLSPPVTQLLTDSVEPAGAGLQPETEEEEEEEEANEEGSDQIMKEEEEQRSNASDGCAVPFPVKEANICEQQEGMSTQQCVGGGAESGAVDWTAQGETEGKHDAQDEGGEIQLKEETGVMFYPGWYKRGAGAGLKVKSRTQTETRDAESDLQVHPPLCQNSQTHIEDQDLSYPNHLLSGPLPHALHNTENLAPLCEFRPEPYDNGACISVPQVQQTAGDGGAIRKGDMQDQMCPSGTVVKGLRALEGSFGLEDGSLHISSGNSYTTLPILPEETSSDVDKGKFELRGRLVEETEEKEELEEDPLGLNEASGLKEKELGDEYEILEEGSEVQRQDFSELQWDDAAKTEESARVKNETLREGEHHSGQSRENSGADFEPGGSVFVGNEDEDLNKEPDGMETCVAESKEKITTCVPLQAVTLFFYLLAFLVILQRVWAYIGCFICT